MTLHQFLNRLKSLYNIDGYLLPELNYFDWVKFRDHPSAFFINADDGKRAAIWREVEKRQRSETEPKP